MKVHNSLNKKYPANILTFSDHCLEVNSGHCINIKITLLSFCQLRG